MRSSADDLETLREELLTYKLGDDEIISRKSIEIIEELIEGNDYLIDENKDLRDQIEELEKKLEDLEDLNVD